MVGKLGGIDQEAIGRYNNAIIDDGMDFADAFEKATTLDNGSFVKLNEETLALINNAKNAEVAENDLKEAVAKYGDAAQKASGASKALSVGMNILTTFAISAAISLLSKGIEYLANYSDHMAESLRNSKSAVQENEQKISDLNLELETTANRLKELNELSGKRSLTPVEQEEVDNLRKYNDELERQISYEQARSRINQRTMNADFIKSVDTITSKQTMGYVEGFNGNRLDDEYNQYIQQTYASRSNSGTDYTLTQSGRFEYNKSEIKRLAEERTSLVADVVSIQSEIDSILAKGEENITEEDRKNINKLSSDIGDLNNEINKIDKSTTDAQSKMSDYVDSLIEAADGMEYFEGTSLTPDQKKQNALLDYIKYVQQEYIDIDNASSQAMTNFNAVFENVEFSDLVEQLKLLAQNGELTADVITSQFALMASRWEELGWTAEDVANQINSMFASSTQNAGITSSFDAISSSLFSNTEAYKALTAAMDEQASAGVLSIETYNTLLEQIPEINDLLVMTSEGYALNTEAVYDYIKAQNNISKSKALEQIQELQDKMRDLEEENADQSELDFVQSEINGFETIVRNIDSATNALERFKAAQKTENQGSAFESTKDAYQVIKDAFDPKSKTFGQVGSDDFKSAMSLFLGEDWKANVDGDVQEAWKQVQASYKKYFGQDKDTTALTNFRDALTENGFASFDKKTGQLEILKNPEGQLYTIEEMSSKLGMTEETVRSMLSLMKLYGAEFKYPVQRTQEELDNLEKIKQIQETISALQSKKTELEGQLGQTEVETEEYTSIKGQIEEIDATIASANEELTTLKTSLGEDSGITTVDSALERIGELQTLIDGIESAGIDIPITLSGEYDELKQFLEKNGIIVGEFGSIFDTPYSHSNTFSNGNTHEATRPSVSPPIAQEHVANTINVEVEAKNSTGKLDEAVEQMQNEADSNPVKLPVKPTVEDADPWGMEVAPESVAINADISGVKEKVENLVPEEVDTEINADGSQVESEVNTVKEEVQTIQEEADKVDFSSMNAFQLLDELSKIKEEINAISASGIEVPIELIGQYEELRELLSGKGVDVAPWWVKDPSKLFVENTSTTIGHDLNLPGMGGRPTETVQVVPTVDNNAGDSIIQDIQEQTKGNPVEVEVEQTPKHDLTLTPHEQTSKPKHDLTLTPREQTVEVHADTSNVASEVESAVPDIKTNVDGNTGGLVATVEKIQNEAEQPAIKPISADTSSASSSITSLEDKAEKKVTKEVNVKITGATALPYAKGTQNAAGGLSLVDEKGAELIEHTKSGTFELGTNNGARFTTLDSGDIVHTASETKKILSRAAKIGGFFRDGLNQTKSIIGNAFATGVSGSMSWSLIESITNAVTKKNSSSSSKSSSSSSSAKKASKTWKSYVEKLFDWVEIRLERLQTVTDAWLLSAKQAIGYIAKNAELEGALSAVQNQIEATTQAYNKYMEQADIVAKKTKLTAASIKKIQEGTIDIESYSDTAKERIQAYREWYEKAQDLVGVLSDLRDQERELATQKLDTIIEHYQWRIDRLDAIVDQNNATLDLKAATGIRVEERDYQDAIDATAKKINELIASKQALTAEFSDMIARGYIQEGSEDWYNYTSELEELDKSIIEVQTDLQDLKDSMNNVTLTNLQYALFYLENSAATINDMMNLHEAQGTDNLATDYEKLIRNGMQQIKNLETQNAEILKQQSGLDVLSEKYKELQDQIESNNRSIMDMKVSQEEWNDAVLDLKISELEKFRDELTKTNDKYEKQLELQQAIEDLQRASTQRTQRVFRDGIGMVYETNADELQQAQEKFDQVLHNQTLDKIDEVIDSINDFKNDTNVYDINGNLLGQQYSLPNVGDLSALISSSGNKNVLTSAVEDVFKSAYNEVMRNIANGNAETNLSIGDVIVNGAETPDELAEAIVNDLPNAMVQALYKKLK